MNKNYNYTRRKLILPEYGRHIQQMVDGLAVIEDRQERNQQALAVIAVMGNLNPVLRDSGDFTHKLWDHLFIMSDFKLDVDSPYPIPTAASLSPKPQRLEYPQKRIKMKYYGKNIEKILHKLTQAGDPEAVEQVVGNLARFMRAKSYEFNQEHPNNEIIIRDIRKLSNNSIEVDEIAINNIKSDYKSASSPHVKNGYKNGKNGKNKNVKTSNKVFRKRPLL